MSERRECASEYREQQATNPVWIHFHLNQPIEPDWLIECDGKVTPTGGILLGWAGRATFDKWHRTIL
jgi:hypothetical protein